MRRLIALALVFLPVAIAAQEPKRTEIEAALRRHNELLLERSSKNLDEIQAALLLRHNELLQERMRRHNEVLERSVNPDLRKLQSALISGDDEVVTKWLNDMVKSSNSKILWKAKSIRD